jgi:hypothetical protein
MRDPSRPTTCSWRLNLYSSSMSTALTIGVTRSVEQILFPRRCSRRCGRLHRYQSGRRPQQPGCTQPVHRALPVDQRADVRVAERSASAPAPAYALWL